MIEVKCKIHRIKTWPTYYQDIIDGKKSFEIRKNDRNYCVGDCLILQEYDPINDKMTGREYVAMVKYIMTSDVFPQAISSGYCIMGIESWEVSSDKLGW